MATSTPTSEQLTAGFTIVRAVADAIRELGTVPSGHLYARMMSHMSIDDYEQVIGILCRANMVKRDADHLLTWIENESD